MTAALSEDRMGFYKAEYERLAKRRELWGALSNDHFRMRRLGGLQTQMERVEQKAAAANNAIGRLLKQFDAEVLKVEQEAVQLEIEKKERSELARLQLKFSTKYQ